ncbi:MAG TPA: F0F1 ATP synthase subunit delta [Oligoflexia bacterium]|mgnify:CR=1 FL=1|nr:F0F1 ATP synthase subunit delta [Oligoflexia bacterium]HMP48162.1 F0F1 ATP synthase subunit delta [Oligoflexia bacterium]
MSKAKGSVSRSKIGVRYARAFLSSLGFSESSTGSLSADSSSSFEALRLRAEVLTLFSNAFREDREILFTLQNPMIDLERKKGVVLNFAESVFRNLGERYASVQKDITGFLAVVLDNGRISEIVDIARSFQGAVNEIVGIVPVRVYTSRELPQNEKEYVSDHLQRFVSGAVECSWIIDKSILGGCVFEFAGQGRFAGKRIDASLEGRLTGVRQELLGS